MTDHQEVMCKKLHNGGIKNFGVPEPPELSHLERLPLIQHWDKRKPREGATAYFAYNDDYLYFYVYLEDSRIFTSATENNQELYLLGDVAEFFIKPRSDRDDYWEIHVSPNNLIMDIQIANRDRFISGEITWDEVIVPDSRSEYRGEVVNGGSCWAADLKVPWSAFEMDGPPPAGQSFHVAVCRYNYPGSLEREGLEISSTAPLKEDNFHHIEDYTDLVFV